MDPSVDGTGDPTASGVGETWSVTFANSVNGGMVSGIASCNSLTSTWGVAHPEYNNQISKGYQDDGLHCWCRMTSPVRSAWVYTQPKNSASHCAAGCANTCSILIHDYADFRTAVFNSAGN